QRENELTSLSRGIAVIDDVSVLIELNVGLTDDVLVLFPRRQVEGPWLIVSLARFAGEFLVTFFDLFERHVIAGLELRVTPVDDANVLHDPAVTDLPVRGLDEAKLVDTREAGETRNQSDVRTFRRLNGTNAPVVCRVNVAHLEPGAFTRQTTRSKCR